jgi:hypothetical protein
MIQKLLIVPTFGKIGKVTFKLGPMQLTSDDHQVIQHALAKARD